MWLDAALAYLHYMAIFILFAFLTVQAMVLAWLARPTGRAPARTRGPVVRRLGHRRARDGMLRAGAGAKGGRFLLQRLAQSM
jgi:hypothetical protein